MKRRLFSETIGIPVIAEHVPHRLSVISDILIDHSTGKIIAFLLPRHRMIVPLDVLEWSDHMLIPDEYHVLHQEEVVRVKEYLEHRIHFFSQKVYTESGKYLGRIHDMTFDATTQNLLDIHVAKFFFLFRYDELTIERSRIIDIRKDKVIVKDPLERKREKAKVPSSEWMPA